MIAVLAASLLAAPADAEKRQVLEAEGKSHSRQVTYDGFYISITSSADIVDVTALVSDDGVIYDNATIEGGGSRAVGISFTGLDIPADDGIGVAVEFRLEEWGTYRITKAWIENAGSGDPTAEPTPALGFSVQAEGQYALTNAYAQSIAYTDLQYTVVPSAMSMTAEEYAELLEDIAEGLPYGPGWTFLPGGTVPAGGQSGALVTLDIETGQYLYSFMTEDFSAGGGDMSFTLQGHEHQAASPMIKIDKVEDTYPGCCEYVSITTEGSQLEMGGFSFLIAYETSALTFMEAFPGQFLEDCGWEYFTYRSGLTGDCGGSCPSGILRIVSIADVVNGAHHPSCFAPPDSHPHELATMKFNVTHDITYDCSFVPIRFLWLDCGNNALSNVLGDALFISNRVYEFDGTDITGDDAYGGHWWLGDCGNPDPDKPSALPIVDFTNGGVDIICVDSIDLRGDINLNDIPYEIGDAVLFTAYFIFGPVVFTINAQAQIAASDVNYDGVVLTVGDLVYLIRILTGEIEPGEKLQVREQSASVGTLINHSAAAVFIDAESDVGAGCFVFEHSGYEIGEPHLINGASDMTLKFHDEDGVLRILVYSMDTRSTIQPQLGNVIVIPLSGSGTINLIETELSDPYGNMFCVAGGKPNALPESYLLHQNYPNPFNASTRIIYELPRTSHVEIAIFNVMGRRVRTLLSRVESAGVHTAEWDGRDQSGNFVASGVYLYRLTGDGSTIERKMVLLK